MRVTPRDRRPLYRPHSSDALNHAGAMVLAPVALGLFGLWLDSEAGTGPLFLVILAVFGVASSLTSAYYRYKEQIRRLSSGKRWNRKASA